MTTAERTWLMDLLPYIHRLRDEETGGPLGGLLSVVAEQVEALQDDVDDLYADWFIETCRDWVVPYIGELVGYRPGASALATADVGSREWQLRARYLVPRRDVANSVAHRRRKGALALLEQLAFDVAGWPARAVEHHPLLVVDQHLNHLHLDRGRTVDLRDRDGLDRIGGAFDDTAHAVAAGRITSSHTRRRHDIPNVGLFVWRLQPFRLKWAPARNIDRAKNRFTFDVLGVDQPLVTKPIAEPDATHIADELNVPGFIRRIALETNTADYYDPGDSLCLFRPVAGSRGDHPKLEPIPASAVVSTDLTGWQYRPHPGQVAIDPVLGRIAFHPRESVNRGIWVSYHHAFSGAMGGGEYIRPLRPIDGRKPYSVGRGSKYPTIAKAYAQWEQDRVDPMNRDAVIEINDNEEYVEAVRIQLRPGQRLEIRAAQGRSPLIRLVDLHANRPDSWEIEGLPAEDVGATDDEPQDAADDWSDEFEAEVGTEADRDAASDAVQQTAPRQSSGSANPAKGTTGSAALSRAAPPTAVSPIHAHPQGGGGQETGTQDGASDQPTAKPESSGTHDATSDGGRDKPSTQDGTSAHPEGSGTRDGTSDGGSSQPPTHGGTSDGGSKPPTHGDATTSDSETTSGKPDSGHKPDKPDPCPPLPNRPAPDSPPRLVLDGLTIAGRSVRISGEIGMVLIRHSTLVPGWWLDPDCCPTDEDEASLELDDLCGGLVIEQSIVGTIVVSRNEVSTEPIPIAISDSIIDATRPDLDALAAPDGRRAHASLTIRRSTVFGRLGVHRMELGEDSIFADHVSVTRRQVGCVRFSFVPLGSRTPRRYECQPDAARLLVEDGFAGKPDLAIGRANALAIVDLRVRPRFDSVRYRTPAYARLAELCPVEISAGASDGSEMGAFHDLFQPIREANLSARLDEFTPAGSDAGILFET
jgi:hypothetical protein